MKEAVEVKLKEPIKWGSEIITEIKLQTPKAKHVKDMDLKNVGVNEILKLTSKLSQISLSALDELGMEDLFSVTEAVGNLLGNGQGTGSKD